MTKRILTVLLISILIVGGGILASCQHVCNYGEWEIVKEPTCTEKGYKERVCLDSSCGKKDRQDLEIDPTKHKLQPVNGEDADCTTDGILDHNHCSLCGKNFDAEGNELASIVIAKGHKYEPVSEVAATNHATGIIAHRECKACNKKFDLQKDEEITDIVIPAKHTDYDADNLYCPTCDEYVILNAEQLSKFRDSVNGGNDYSGKTVVLDADIDLNNVEWIPINLFKGTFDGRDHIIKNLKITGGDSVGLFGNQWQCKAVISNFTIDGANIQGGANVGVVVGRTASTSIKNVKVCNAEVTSNHYAGGIVGYAYCKIEGCQVENLEITCIPDLQTDGKYDNGDKVGGIVGYLCAGTVSGCSVANASLKGYRDIGGIVGTLQASGGVETFAKSNTSNKVIIIVDQVTNGYGAKDMNVDGVVGRKLNEANNPAVVENNDASEISYEYIVDSASAQKALDSAKSDSTIKLAPGEYDKLYIRQSGVVSVKTNEGSSPWYKRDLVNFTLVGNGATINGIEFISGHIHSSDNSVTDPVTGNKQNYYSNLACKNIVFENITFADYMEFNGWESTLFSVDGLKISNCRFDMSDSAKASKTGTMAAIHIGSSDGERNLKNFEFDSCEFSNAFQGIYTFNVENMSVKNCQFDNITHNAVAMQSSDQSSVGGIIVIENNTFTSGTDRVVRFNLIDATAHISFADNVITDYCDNDGEIIKSGIMSAGATLKFENNSYGGTVLQAQNIVGEGTAVVIKNA